MRDDAVRARLLAKVEEYDPTPPPVPGNDVLPRAQAVGTGEEPATEDEEESF